MNQGRAVFNRALQEKLRGAIFADVLFDEPLSPYTSFGVGGKADALVFPGSSEELRGAVRFLSEEGVPFVSIGNGTNLIVRDGGYRGVVFCLKRLRGLEMEEKNGRVCLHAEAGLPLAELIALSLREGLTGMEFCAGVPGSVGGAIRMNAGAFGSEIGNVAETVTFLTAKGEIISQARKELTFRYRAIELLPGAIILSAAFTLCRGDAGKIREEVERIHALRREKHPLTHRSAGSIFKNPPHLSAGRIIDEIGLKGQRVGDAQVSEMHGNFIVNMGRATARDIIQLIDLIKKKVQEERGIVLEIEVQIIGDDAEDDR